MTIQDILSNAKHFIPNLTKHRDVVIATQRVIKTINQRHQGLRDTKTIITPIDSYTGVFTFASATKTINDDGLGDFTALGFTAGDKIWFAGTGALNTTALTIVSIQNDAATNDQITVSEVIVNDAAISGSIVGFTLLSGYSYEYLTGVISFPESVKEVIEIFADGSELDAMDYDDVNSGEFNECYAATARRTVQISTDVNGMTIELKAWYDIDNITATSQITVINVPKDYEDIIQDGVIYYLTSMPTYKDEFLNKENKESFFSALQLLNQSQMFDFPTPRRSQRKFY